VGVLKNNTTEYNKLLPPYIFSLIFYINEFYIHLYIFTNPLSLKIFPPKKTSIGIYTFIEVTKDFQEILLYRLQYVETL